MASPNLSASAIAARPAFGSSACNAVSAWTRCTSTWVWESAPRPSGPPESPVVGGDRSRGRAGLLDTDRRDRTRGTEPVWGFLDRRRDTRPQHPRRLTALSLERCALAPRELMLARIAALIAVDAPPVSYMANAAAAADSGITGDDLQALMIGISPVVGTPKIVAAAGNIFRALGFAIIVAEAELAEMDEAADAAQ